MHYHWEQAAAKNGTWQLRTAHVKQKSSVTLTVFNQNNSRAVYIVSYESCKPKKFSRCCNKVERNCIQEQQSNQIHCYNQNMGLSTEWTLAWPVTRLVFSRRNSGSPHLREWQMFFRVRGYCIVLTKMKAMSLCLFQFFEEILPMQFF